MRKIIFILILFLGIIGGLFTLAYGAEEKTEGKVIWEKLQAKEIDCQDLSNDDFKVLGEYFMGQMAGSQHEAMDNMMIQMMGEEFTEQMHIAIGKRTSSCQPEMPMPQNMMNGGMMPMMMKMMMGGGMMGNWSNPNNSMMANMMDFGYWGAWGWLNWIMMILFWVLIILGIAVLIKWLIDQLTGRRKGKSALDILNERYAKGEISKEELEEKRKDLTGGNPL